MRATGATTLSRMPELTAEDTKLVTLARATRVRAGANQGAAVRDENGRTYAAASVALPSLEISAVQVCVAMAISSGSQGLESVVLLADTDVAGEADLAVIRDFAGGGVPIHFGDARGQLSGSATS